MSSEDADGEPANAACPCKRCAAREAALVVRAEPLCKDCFIKYVHTKIIKRMESFRVRNAPGEGQRRLLLPVSFGVSSMTLLHVLDGHTHAQVGRTGRAGFDLHVLHVASEDDNGVALTMNLEKLKERYPRHEYTVLTPLENIGSHAVEQSTAQASTNGEAVNRLQFQDVDMTNLIGCPASPTSRTDISEIARTRTIVKAAQDLSCEAILWGHTTTCLAEKILAETAKGRGFSLPWLVNDGQSPFGVNAMHPLRDLLKKEVVSYVELLSPALDELVGLQVTAKEPASSKNTAIDALMKDYIQSVEANYPSIVANVVRTSSKLNLPSEAAPPCALCMMPVQDSRFGTGGWGGSDEGPTTDEARRLCYGCTRSTTGMKTMP